MTKRDQTIAAAVDIARYDGIAAITSVAVGERLGVTQSAIYRHVRDVDELRTLAIHRLVGELDEELASIVTETGALWGEGADFDAFLTRLVDALSNRAAALRMLDRWRFADTELGEGIRERLLRGRDGIAALLENEWRQNRTRSDPLTTNQRAMLRAHAQLIQDDIIAVARLVRAGRFPGGRQAIVRILKSRVIAGWSAFSASMDASSEDSVPSMAPENA